MLCSSTRKNFEEDDPSKGGALRTGVSPTSVGPKVLLSAITFTSIILLAYLYVTVCYFIHLYTVVFRFAILQDSFSHCRTTSVSCHQDIGFMTWP